MPACSRRTCQLDFDVWQKATKESLRFCDKGMACFGLTRQRHIQWEDIERRHTRAKFKHHTNCQSRYKMQLSTAKISWGTCSPLSCKEYYNTLSTTSRKQTLCTCATKASLENAGACKISTKATTATWSCSQVAQHIVVSCTQHQDHIAQITETPRKTPRYSDNATLSGAQLLPMPTSPTSSFIELSFGKIIKDRTPPCGTPELSQRSTEPGDFHRFEERSNCGRHLSLSARHSKNPSAEMSVRTNFVPPL